MKRILLSVALSGLLSVTVLAGEVPINGSPTPLPPAQFATVSTALANVVLTILLIGR